MKLSGGLSSGSSYKYFLGQWQQAALGERIITSSHVNYDGLHLCFMVVQWSWYLYRWPTTSVTVSSCTVCLERQWNHNHVSPFVMHLYWVLRVKNHWYWIFESKYVKDAVIILSVLKEWQFRQPYVIPSFFTTVHPFHDQYQKDYLQSSAHCPLS